MKNLHIIFVSDIRNTTFQTAGKGGPGHSETDPG